MPSTHPNPTTFPAPLVGVSPIQVVPQNLSRLGLFVYNPGVSVSLAISGDDVTPAINGGGSITLPPGQGIQLDGWTRAVLAIASSGASNAITVQEYS